MTLNKNTFLLLLVSLALLSSCSRKKKNVAAGYIPADASAVVAINAHQLMNKLGKDSITLQKLSMLVMGPMADTATNPTVFWSGAETSGVDFKEPVYISLNIPSKITDQNAVLRIIVQLKNREQFAKTIDILDGDVSKEKDFTYITTDESAIGFNNKTAIYVAHLNADAITGTKTTGIFSLDSLDDVPEPPDFTGKMALELVKSSFSLQKENSLAGNDDFDELPIGDNDMKMWANYTTGIEKMLKGNLAEAAVVLRRLLTNSYSASVINFENGAIKGTSRMYFSKESAEVVKKAASKNIDLSAVSAFPGKTLNTYIGMAFDPAMMRHIIEYIKWDGAANMGLSLIGLSLDDFLNALTGEVSIIFADAGTLPAGNAMGGPVNSANWAAVARINNTPALEKILNNKKVLDSLKKTGSYYVMEKDSTRIYFNIKNNNLYVGGNPQLLAQFMDGTKKNDFASGPLARFSKNPFGLYMSTSGLSTAGAFSPRLPLLSSSFSEMTVTGQHFEKNFLQSNMEMMLPNKQKNALSVVFNTLLSQMQSELRLVMPKEDEEFMPPLVPMEVK